MFSKDEAAAAPAAAAPPPVVKTAEKAPAPEPKQGFFKRVFGSDKSENADEDDDGLPDSGVETSPPVD